MNEVSGLDFGTPAESLTIANRQDGSSLATYLNGTIDDVMIFNRTLTAEQVLALYNNRTDLIVSQETRGGEEWFACVTPNDGTEDGDEACSNALELQETSDLWANETINFNDSSPRQNDTVEMNLTVHSDLSYNYTNVNVSLYVDAAYYNSTFVNVTDGYGVAYFNWTAEPGNKSILIAVDADGEISESNESNNNASSYLFVAKVAVIEYLSPVNSTGIIRGKTDGGTEDPRSYVPDYTVLTARVFDYFSASEGIAANCTFYFNGTYLGMNETGSGGNCTYGFDHTVYDAGEFAVAVNFTDLDPVAEGLEGNISANATLTIATYNATNEELNTRPGLQYMLGDAAVLAFNVTRNGTLFDPNNITVEARKSSPDFLCHSHTYPGDIVRTGTGEYYSKTIVDDCFGLTDIHWYIYIDDNLTIGGVKQEQAIPAASGSHSDVQLVDATAAMNLTAIAAGGSLLENTSVTVYDRNLYELETDVLNSSDPDLYRPAAQNDTYRIEYAAENGTGITINSVNATADVLRVSPQVVEDYSGTLPGEARTLSQVMAMNDSLFNFTNATISIPIGGLSRVDYIFHCSEWNFDSGDCSNWEQNETSDYPDYAINSTHFSFTVSGFTAYAGGDGYNANLTIYDEYEGSSASDGASISFYANYTNGTTGAHISGAECNITFDDGASAMMVDSGDNYNYTKAGGFAEGGLHYWNATCNATGYDALNATDDILVTAAPQVTLDSPGEGHATNLTSLQFSFTAVDGDYAHFNCSIYINGAYNQSNASTMNDTPTTFTVSGFQDGAHNWSVSCIDNSSETGTSETRNFTVDTVAPTISISSPANITYATNNISVNYTTNGSVCFLVRDGLSSVALPSCGNTTFSNLTEGQHYVTIYANDSVNNSNSSTVYFTVDMTAPAISITSPANLTYSTNNFTVNYTTTGESCSLFLNGTFNRSLTSCENTTLSNLTEGQHYVTIYSNDSVNNTGSATIYFTVNLLAPNITIESPLNITYTTNNLTVNYTTDGVSCSMFLDGTFNASLTSCENTTLTELAEGQHYVMIYSNDSINNSASWEVYFTIDTVAPGITIDSPANTTYSTNNLSVNYTTDGDICLLVIDGTSDVFLPTCGNTTLTELSEAQHYVTIYANDSVNNSASDEIYFIVDLSAPGVTIDLPLNITYATNNFTINYTTSGESCSLFLDGAFNESLSSCENTTLSNLSEAQHYVTIYANDSVNNTGSDEIYFTVDLSAPGVIINSPANTTYTINSVTVNYTTSGESCSLFLNGTFNQSLTSCENTTLSGLADGQHYVTIYSNDSVNNTGSATIYFTVNPLAPNITIESPLNATYATNNFTINYTTSGESCSLFLNGTFNQSLTSCENTTLSGLADGQHYVTIYSNDSVNNTGEAAAYFIVDTAYPALEVSSPANTTYLNSSVSLNYTAGDSIGMDACWYELDGTPQGELAGCQNTTLTSLTDAQYYVTVYVNDTAGNTNSSTVYFTVYTGAPLISISSPANTTYNSSTVDVNYTVGNNPDECWLYVDDALNESLPTCANTTLADLSEGQHNITLYVNDTLGTISDETVHFTVDLTYPTLTLYSPEENVTYNSSTIPIEYEAGDSIGISSCTYELDGASMGSIAGCQNTSFYTTAGSHNLTLYVTDYAGHVNSSTAYFNSTYIAPERGGGKGEEFECFTSSDCPECMLCRGHECMVNPNIEGACSNASQCNGTEYPFYECISCRCSGYECRNTTDCPETEICVNATCVPGFIIVGIPCTGEICPGLACTNDSGCPAGSICIDSECAVFGCNSSAECKAGELCVDHFCTVPGCLSDAGCKEGEICVDYSCTPGENGTEEGGASEGEEGGTGGVWDGISTPWFNETFVGPNALPSGITPFAQGEGAAKPLAAPVLPVGPEICALISLAAAILLIYWLYRAKAGEPPRKKGAAPRENARP